MGYLEETLTKNESVLFETKLHPVMFLWPILLLGFSLQFGESGALLTGIAFIWGLYKALVYFNSIFVITNQRILVKIGFIARNTREINLSKLESVAVDQSVLGRILNYGTLTFIGTGGTREPFSKISHPIELRKTINDIHAKSSLL